MTQTLTAPAAVTERASVKDTAAALRRHLRNAFPGTRFSVTMERGSAYGWIHVSWTDGPRWAEVRPITERYESSRFDGRDDGYHATGNSRWNCCGVSTHRAMSAEIHDREGTKVWAVAPGCLIVGACEACYGHDEAETAIRAHFNHTTY